MEELLRFVCGALEQRGIQYMLSGSLALNAYSVSRMTRDIDLVIELRADNFSAFAEIFEGRDCYFHQESALEEVARRGMFNVIDRVLGGKIDFIVRKEDAFQREEFRRKARLPVLSDFDCWVISAEDLVIAKLLWIQELYSERQLDDIRNVIRDYKPLDRDYIIGWVAKMKLNDFNVLNE